MLASTPFRPDVPLFVFLPGLDGTGTLFDVQAARLASYFDVRCLSLSPVALSDWDELADQVLALIERDLADRQDGSVYLCGESFGACLALQVALRSPPWLKRLILVNPASSFRRRPFFNWSSVVTTWLPTPLYEGLVVGLLPWLAVLDRLQPVARQALLQAMQSVPQMTSAWRLSLLNQFEIAESRIQRIQQPVLLIAGAADHLLPSVSEVQHLAQQLPDGKAVILPQSGHACLLEVDIDLYAIMRKCNFLDAIATRYDSHEDRDTSKRFC